MPNFAAMWAGFLGALRDVWANFMTLISSLSTFQLLLVLAGCIAALWIVKVILSPGGARKRMKGMAAVWVMIPFLVAFGGAIIYFVIKILAKAPQVVT